MHEWAQVFGDISLSIYSEIKFNIYNVNQVKYLILLMSKFFQIHNHDVDSPWSFLYDRHVCSIAKEQRRFPKGINSKI